MEKNYLYPGDSVKPIEVGEGYKDYLLTDYFLALGYDAVSVVVSSYYIAFLGSYEWVAVISYRRKGQDSPRCFCCSISCVAYQKDEYREQADIKNLVLRIYDKPEGIQITFVRVVT